MKLILFFFILTCHIAFGQITETISVNEKLNSSNRETAQKEMIFHATLKLIEIKSSDLGQNFATLNSKLTESFNEYLSSYKERKLIEKFGPNYAQILKEEGKSAFLQEISNDEKKLFINFSNILSLVESYKFKELIQDKIDPNTWSAKVELVLDKNKIEKFFQRVLNNEKKLLSKIFIITDIVPLQFKWEDLSLENELSFIDPLNRYWLKWFAENSLTNIEDVVICSGDCNLFYNKWVDSVAGELSIPEEFYNSAFLKITVNLLRSNTAGPLKEETFKWEGRVVVQDIQTKQIIANSTIFPESRKFISLSHKATNSALASSISRLPLPLFLQLNQKITDKKMGVTRSKKLVLTGYKNSGDVFSFVKMIKDRGNLLSLDVSIDNFSKDQTIINCFYKGEEKSFTDLLSSIKELKSYNNYALLNDFNGAQSVIKFVAE